MTGEVIAVFVPVPEFGYRVFYRVLDNGFDGPYQDEACTILVELGE